MKYPIAFLMLTPLALGQQRLTQDEATAYAKACVGQVAVVDAQIDMKVDPEKAVAVQGEGGGAMVIPDNNLSKRPLKLDKNVTAIGQLWLRKWTLVNNSKPVPDANLRIEKPRLDDKERPMPLLLLGIRQETEKPELVIYGSGPKPIQVLPLTKTEIMQTLPVEMEWERGEKNVDKLPLTILGQYRAEIRVTRK